MVTLNLISWYGGISYNAETGYPKPITLNTTPEYAAELFRIWLGRVGRRNTHISKNGMRWRFVDRSGAWPMHTIITLS